MRCMHVTVHAFGMRTILCGLMTKVGRVVRYNNNKGIMTDSQDLMKAG